MPAAPKPHNEDERLDALRELDILDTETEEDYDDITLLAAQICGVPMAIISLVDADRQWFKSKIGLDAAETHRDQAFCAHAILTPSETLVVEDAMNDPRFEDNPLVLGDPNIRFYAGAPISSGNSHPLGTLCVLDRVPGKLTDQQQKGLEALARQLSLKLELRRMSMALKNANDQLHSLSLTDDLTGLYNQRGFHVLAEQQIKLFRSRASQRSMWLMLMDMDGLKSINDRFGHLEGSAAIKAAADVLVHTFRDADILSRFGGDEFTALLVNAQDEVADRITERLAANFAAYNQKSGKPYELAASVGFARVEFGDNTSVDDLIEIADAAMYLDKRRRKAER